MQNVNDPEVFLTEDGRALLGSRIRELRDRADTLLGILGQNAGEAWTVSEHRRVVEELDRLSATLAAARAVEDVPEDSRVVLIGDTVRVRLPDGSAESYVVVHPVEAPVDEARISSESPLGAALLGRKVGDEVEVSAPSGPYRCTVVRAEREA